MNDFGKIKKDFNSDCDYLQKVGLENCPFCGGEAYTDSLMSPEIVRYVIKCGICGAQTKSTPKLRFAINIWNRRIRE